MKKKKFRNSQIFFSAIIIVVIVITVLNSIQKVSPIISPIADISSLPQLSTQGYEEVGISVEVGETVGLVKLSTKCYEMTGNVEPAQAISIQDGIEGKIGPRPNTHDLFKDLLKALNIKILQIKVTEIRDNAFISQMIVQQGNTVLALDARPSDAIAVGARTDYLVPILVNETLLKTIGEKIC